MYDLHHFDSKTEEETSSLTSSSLPDSVKDLFVAISEHLCCDLSGETVILNMRNGKYYGLNEVGGVIWNAIKSPAFLSGIQAGVMQKYEIDADTCEREVLIFLRKMHHEGLVEIVHESVV